VSQISGQNGGYSSSSSSASGGGGGGSHGKIEFSAPQRSQELTSFMVKSTMHHHEQHSGGPYP